MTDQIEDFEDLLGFWPSRADFAAHVSQFTEKPVPESRIFQWLRAGRILKKYWPAIMIAAAERASQIESEADQVRAQAERLRNGLDLEKMHERNAANDQEKES